MSPNRIQLSEGEKFIVAIDDHWVSILVPSALMVLGWVFAAGFFFLAKDLIELQQTLGLLLYFVSMGTALFCTHWFFIYLLEWELSTWIVTTRRIIDVRFLPYVRHDVGYIMINEIHEIEKHKHGLIKILLNYGEIEVNLAAVNRSTVFRYVPRPGAFANMIQTIHRATNPDELNVEDLRKMVLM